MMRLFSMLISSLFCLFMSSCHDQGASLSTTTHKKEHLKPIVAIAPVIDSSKSKLPWDISEELTSSIHYRLMQKNRLYLVDSEKIRAVMNKLKIHSNPFDVDLIWIKKAFFENEFVVFLELIEHEEMPIAAKDSPPSAEGPAELSMSMRIRVVDVRGESAKIVLQEIVQNHHYLPRLMTRSRAELLSWDKENYALSPVGMAHAKLSREVASRLEDYILLTLDEQTTAHTLDVR